jgi:hypothetical protein
MVRGTTPDQFARALPALPMGIRRAIVVWFGAAAALWGAIGAATWIFARLI